MVQNQPKRKQINGLFLFFINKPRKIVNNVVYGSSSKLRFKYNILPLVECYNGDLKSLWRHLKDVKPWLLSACLDKQTAGKHGFRMHRGTGSTICTIVNFHSVKAMQT